MDKTTRGLEDAALGAVVNGDSRKRFDREMRILSKLKHPNVVSIFDRVETEEGLSFLVTEFIEGTPIDQFAGIGGSNAGESSFRERLWVFLKAVRAADFVHRAGITHRDLKPSNVLVDRHAEPKLLDFGLARVMPGGEVTASSLGEITASGHFLGSLPWASPEQANGSAVDVRSDVYSLGVIFYQLLTGGYFPYRVCGSVRDVLAEIATAQPLPPSRVKAAIESGHRIDSRGAMSELLEGETDAITLKALAKHPDDRYQSAAEFAQAIEARVSWRGVAEGNHSKQRSRAAQASTLSYLVELPKPLRQHTVVGRCPECGNEQRAPELSVTQAFECDLCGSRIQLQSAVPVSFDRKTSSIGVDDTDVEESVSRYRSRFGRFELLAEVGAGGFGTVFKARDPKLDRVVALKIPHTRRLLDEGHRRRFVQEARHVAKIRHEGIIPVFEAGEAEGIPYLVAEFVEGVTLERQLQSRRPPVEEAAGLCIQIAEALHHAHEAGIVHRDVKPSNVMLDGDGRPYLMDFGLAKQETGDSTVSVTGAILGTPAYMSPEQAAGENESVGVRSDVYSLGVVLYQLLTGELPFRGNNNMLIHQILNDDPRSPRTLNDRIPRDLEMICLKAMSKEPRQRYAAAEEFAEDLRRYVRREPVLARPVGGLRRFGLWCQHPDRIGAASTITIAMALMLAIWELQSLVFITTGIVTVEHPLMTAVTIVFGMVFFGTLAGLGFSARHRTKQALWCGAVASVGLLAFSVASLLGYIPIEGLTEEAVRMPVFGFFSISAAFIVVSHAISLVAYYSNRSIMRWARQLRP